MGEQRKQAELTMTVDGRAYKLQGPLTVIEKGTNEFFDTVKAIEMQRDADAVTADTAGELTTGQTAASVAEGVDRAFGIDGDLVHLKIDTPWTRGRNPDSLLLLIFAFRELKGVKDVSAQILLASAIKSRLKIDRVDYHLKKYKDYLVLGGRAKSRTYGLNPGGIEKAGELLSRLFA